MNFVRRSDLLPDRFQDRKELNAKRYYKRKDFHCQLVFESSRENILIAALMSITNKKY